MKRKQRTIGGCGVLAFILLTALAGCAEPKRGPVTPPPIPEPRSSEDAAAGVAMSVTVPPDAWEWMANHANRIGIETTTPIEVLDENQDGVVIHEGTTVTLSMLQDHALVEFGGDNLPTASKRVGIIPLRTTIKSLTLKPDGNGLAKTGVGTWPFKWMSGASAAAAQAVLDDRVEVTLETPLDEDGKRFCGPCRQAEQDYDACKIPLPFKLTVKEVTQQPGQSYPRFSWKGVGGKEWQSVGYQDLATLSYSVLKTTTGK